MYNYSLRFSLAPTLDFNERMNALLDFCQKAKIDEVMFFIAPKELSSGHITIEESKPYTQTILKAKEILKERGIITTLNPWVTLGHYDVGVPLKEGQNFRTMVGHDGAQSQIAVCPLCENWRKYYVDLMNFYVENLEPEVLWIEDDMRMGNHSDVKHGCFCDEHMRLYNERLGKNYDRETFVSLIATEPLVRKAYLDVVRESIQSTIEYIAKNVSKQKTFGVMTGGSHLNEARQNEKVFRALAKKGGRPQNRCCLFAYRQRGLQEYAWAYNKLGVIAKALTADTADCVMEIENVPHSRYTKSTNFFRYQMLTSVSMLFTGATFSMFEFNGNGANNYERHAKMLADVKPYLSAINDFGLSYADAKGIRVLINENSAYTMNSAGVFDLTPMDTWIYAYLTQLGIACAFTTDVKLQGQVVGVSGQVLRNYDDETVIELFKNNSVIITADNVVELYNRKLSYLVGVNGYKYYEQASSGKYSFEEMNSNEKIFGLSRFRAPAHQFCGDYCKFEYFDGNREVYTVAKNYKDEYFGDAFTRVGNSLIIPYQDNDSHLGIPFPISMLCPLREYAVNKYLSQIPFCDEIVSIAEENVCPYFFEKDGKDYLFCVNFVDDDYLQLHIRTDKKYSSIQIVAVGEEKGRDAKFFYENGEYIVDEPLAAQTSYVLICH